MKRNYVVAADGEVAGRWRCAGEPVAMSEEEARYLAPPLGSILKPADERRMANDGKLDGNKRRRRNRPAGLAPRPAVDSDDTHHAAG